MDSYQAVLEKTSISALIGSSVEGQTLWESDPSVPLSQSLEPLAKGVHRFLVPLYSQNPAPTNSTIPPSTAFLPAQFALLTQSDVIRYLYANLIVLPDPALTPPSLLRLATTATVGDLGLCSGWEKSNTIAAFPAGGAGGGAGGGGGGKTLMVTHGVDPILPTLTALSARNVGAVPVVDAAGRLLATLSSSDFRRLLVTEGAYSLTSSGDSSDMIVDYSNSITTLAGSLANVSVAQFLDRSKSSSNGAAIAPGLFIAEGDMIEKTVFPSTRFAEAVRRVVQGRVHRLWIVDEVAFGTTGQLVPYGVISLGDLLHAFYQANREAM